MKNSESPDAPKEMTTPNRLGTMLVQHGLLTAAQVQAAQALDGDVAQAVLQLGFITESELTAFFSKNMKIPRLGLQDYQINPETVRLVPQEMCLRYRLLPIDQLGKSLTVAMVNPLDDEALELVAKECGDLRIKPFLCTPADFKTVADRLFRTPAEKAEDEGGMNLASLGLSPSAKPVKAAAKTSPPIEEVDDAQATMLFEGAGRPPAGSPGPLRSSLICLDGWEMGREIEIKGESHSLGRSPDADTTVNSPRISRVHAKLTRNAEYGQETFVITDLNSSNGTFVNNIPVTTTILRHGDRILLGDVLFKFVLLDEVEARFHKDVHHLYSIHKDTGLLPADAWQKELARVVKAGTAFSACLIEVDELARVRQAHGPIAGVIVINDISDLLGSHLETTDLPGDYSADRIAVLLEGKPIESVFPILEDLRCQVEAHTFYHKESRFKSTISIGVGAFSGDDVAQETVIARLEFALDSAISGGRNQTGIVPQ